MPTYSHTAHVHSLDSPVAFVVPGVPCRFVARIESGQFSGGLTPPGRCRVCLDYEASGESSIQVDQGWLLFTGPSSNAASAPRAFVDTVFPPCDAGSIYSELLPRFENWVFAEGSIYSVRVVLHEPDDKLSSSARRLADIEQLKDRLARLEAVSRKELDEVKRVHKTSRSSWHADRNELKSQKKKLADELATATKSRAALAVEHDALKMERAACGAALWSLEGRRRGTAETLAVNMTTPQPYDVCLDFPRLGRQLWTTSAVLSASPYYKDLLSSSFQEGKASDGEVDAEYGASVAPSLVSPSAPFHRVVIKDSAYSTYRALLVWLQTGHIEFARLRSAATSASGGEVKSRGSSAGECPRRAPAPSSTRPLSPPRSSSTSSSSTARAMPLTASPKSVYRLADLLSLPQLKSLALASFTTQLSPSNAFPELYTDAAACYPALRDAALEFAVARWAEVEGASATREVEQRAERGELPVGSARTAMLLARRLAQAEKGGRGETEAERS
ncbi:hypothetical protein JCM8208_004701 [Rhodotorula glutinis]